MKQIVAFKPDCCNKAYMSAYSARRHEEKCYKNPLNKTCLTCGFYSSYQDTVYEGYYFGEPYEHECTRWYCDFDNNNPVEIIRGNVPKNCVNWKQK